MNFPASKVLQLFVLFLFYLLDICLIFVGMNYSFVKLLPFEQIGIHSQPTWELTYVEKGRGTRRIGNKVAPFSDGDLVLVVPGMAHIWNFDSNSADAEGNIANITLTWSQDFVDRSSGAFEEFRSVGYYFSCLDHSIDFRNSEVRDSIVSFMKSAQGKSRTEQIAITLQILAVISGQKNYADAGHFEQKLTNERLVEDIKAFVQCNYKHNITTSVVALRAGMTVSGFCAFWKKYCGEAFMKYLIGLRVENAAYLLSNADMRISEVCYESGFSDVPYFNRVFKKMKGLSPSEYRERFK